MKKTLNLLGTLTLSITASASIIACGSTENPPADTRINLNTNILKDNLYFLKKMNSTQAYNELRSKIKDLSSSGYKNIDEIKKDNTILISIWIAPKNYLTEHIINPFEFVDRVDVKIKITTNNKAFKKMNLTTLSKIEIFNS